MLTFKKFLKEKLYSPAETVDDVDNTKDITKKTAEIVNLDKQQQSLQRNADVTQNNLNNTIQRGQDKIQKMARTSPLNVNVTRKTMDSTAQGMGKKIEDTENKIKKVSDKKEDLKSQLTSQKSTADNSTSLKSPV